MKTEEVVHLLENVYKYNISELSIKSGDEKIIIKNGIDERAVDTVETVTERIEGESKNRIDEENIIKSPLVGRFYAAPAVGSDNYVKVHYLMVVVFHLFMILCLGVIEKILPEGNGASEFKVITDFLQVQILDFIYNMSLKNEDEIVASRETRFRSF